MTSATRDSSLSCFGDSVHHAERLIVQRAGDLGQTHSAAGLIKSDKVSEGAADIDADQITVIAFLTAVHACYLQNIFPGAFPDAFSGAPPYPGAISHWP
jgi:hypothetical protein